MNPASYENKSSTPELSRALEQLLHTLPDVITCGREEKLPFLRAVLDDDGVVRIAPLRPMYVLVELTKAPSARVTIADAREIRFTFLGNDYCVSYAPKK